MVDGSLTRRFSFSNQHFKRSVLTALGLGNRLCEIRSFFSFEQKKFIFGSFLTTKSHLKCSFWSNASHFRIIWSNYKSLLVHFGLSCHVSPQCLFWTIKMFILAHFEQIKVIWGSFAAKESRFRFISSNWVIWSTYKRPFCFILRSLKSISLVNAPTVLS